MAYNPDAHQIIHTDRQSAATIYADLMHQKRMETLMGVQPREDDAKDHQLRRSISSIADRIENARAPRLKTRGSGSKTSRGSSN